MSYLVLKWLHLVGATVLFGTGLGIAFFAWFGYRRGMQEGDIGLIRGVLRLTVIADAIFTATAAVLQPVTGWFLWRMAGGTWPDPWLGWVLGLYVFVGACWLPVVALQIRLRNAAVQARTVGELDARFHRTFAIWFALGWPAFLGVMALFGLMITRGYFR
ncbi:MAG TPA: DUF2269 domain-containing protein [Ramlibacter sp.]|uniref:DUF2269 family protein n=1 Tax=Ramlibacter sp. TaxID=1917967 RepID=UPI002ED21B58